jgi:hypothetical protein
MVEDYVGLADVTLTSIEAWSSNSEIIKAIIVDIANSVHMEPKAISDHFGFVGVVGLSE